jgi:hypothetical protein
LAVSLCVVGAQSHPADTLWTRTYALASGAYGNEIDLAHDGGYVIAGCQISRGKINLIRVDAMGDTLWQRSYGSGTDWLTEGVDALSDGGFVVLGRTSYDNVSNFCLVRTDADGDTLWTKFNEWPQHVGPKSVQETSDGGFLLVGNVFVDKDHTDNLHVMRASSSGDTLWTRSYGGTGSDAGIWGEQTSDGGLVACGYTESYGAGGFDIWFVRMDYNGDTLWTRTYGGPLDDLGCQCHEVSDGGFVLIGHTQSPSDVSPRICMVRTDAAGDTLWTRTYALCLGGSGFSIQETADGGFIAAGHTYVYGPPMEEYAYLVRTDSDGAALWSATYGGEDPIVEARSVVEAYDGGYVAAGRMGSEIYLIRTLPPEYHVLDGRLDSDATMVADGGVFRLYSDWDGEYLYVATQGAATTAGLDHFVLVGEDLSTPVGAPWAKAGTVAARTVFLGNEDTGNYHSWYGPDELQLGSGSASAAGYYLEGLIRLESFLDEPMPGAVYLAMGAYGSPDSAALVGQAPEGDGDGDIGAAEYVSFPITLSSHSMDGDLDPGAALVAINGAFSLYAAWDGENLYVATEGVGQTAGLDHFIFIGNGLYAPSPAPWAKSGTVAAKTLYLGNEDSNNWCGWFLEDGTLPGIYLASASGVYLEGVVRLQYYLGPPIPDGVYIAVGAYESQDGGALTAQAPEGNGDINLDAAEYVYLSLDLSGVEREYRVPAPSDLMFAAGPNPFVNETRIEFVAQQGYEAEVAIYDLRGRIVRLFAGVGSEGGKVSICWDGTDGSGRTVSPGIYFCRLRTGGSAATRKIVLVR